MKFFSLQRWVSALGIQFNEQRVKQVLKSDESKKMMNLRCLVSVSRFAQGEPIAVIPSTAILDGGTAAKWIRAAPHGGKLLEAVMSLPSSGCCLAWREPLLLTMFLALAKLSHNFPSAFESDASTFVADCPFHHWVKQLPPSVPLFGPLLAISYKSNFDPREEGYIKHRKEEELEAMEKGMRTAAALADCSALIPIDEQQQPPAVVEGSDVQQLCTVELTDALKRDFFLGRTLLTSAEQAQGTSEHFEENCGFGRVVQLEKQLQTSVINPLANAIRQCNCYSRLPLDGISAALRWAHFMVRSRAINTIDLKKNIRKERKFKPLLVSPAIVPLHDMINHSVKESNCCLHSSPAEEDDKNNNSSSSNAVNYVLTATKEVKPGDELTSNYGSFIERLVLFEKDPLKEAEKCAEFYQNGGISTSTGGNGVDAPALVNRKRAAVQIKAIEDEQRFGYIPTYNSSSAFENYDGVKKWFQEAPAEEDPHSLRARRGEAVSDADWIWFFGFTKSSAEKAYEASCEWHQQLLDRVARMTDMRRGGRRGEFVVGVPEGLRALHAERERLQRERYGGKQIFPKQAR